MTRVRSFQVAAFLTLAVLVLAGCGGISDADQPAPTATEAPAMPQAGATYTGPISLRTSGPNATAAGGELGITITADGSAIASAELELRDTRCTNDAGTVTIESGGFTSTITPAQPTAISNGAIEFDLSGLTMSGRFTSSTEATATVEIAMQEYVGPGDFITCDYGSWDWSGTAE